MKKENNLKIEIGFSQFIDFYTLNGYKVISKNDKICTMQKKEIIYEENS